MTHPSPDQNTINLQLAKAIKELPEERQFILLKQLLKGDIVGTLFKLIGDMSEDRQSDLLKHLREGSTPLTSREETEIALRGHNRKSCMLRVSYTVAGRAFESFLLDISPAGAFIETGETFSAGQPIQLTFSIPGVPQPITITGEILWKGILGMGVGFKDVSLGHSNMITAFMEAKEEL